MLRNKSNVGLEFNYKTILKGICIVSAIGVNTIP
jgi:hypothetical protein